MELVRYTFPAGKVIERAAIDPIPKGPVYWAPDRSDRILFAAGDGRLYRYDFSAGNDGGRGPGEAQPVPLQWGAEEHLGGRVWLQDPCWPDEPVLGGWMLVSLVPPGLEDIRVPPPASRLWWMRPDRDVTSIAASGRAVLPDGDSPAPDVEERLPNVGRANDGTLLLAYLARPAGRRCWELWLAPVALDAAEGRPRVLASARRQLADGCDCITPSFSPDGRWIFAALHDAQTGFRLHRFAVNGPLDRPCIRGDATRKCASPSRRLKAGG
jgi:hypothetical protein